MTSVYCTLADVNQELRSDNVLDATEDRKIMRLIRSFSRRIDRKLGSIRPFFVAYREDRSVAIDGANINSGLGTLMLTTTQGGPSPMLDFTSATVNGSSLTIGTQIQAYPQGLSPIMTLQLMGYTTWSSLTTCAGGTLGPAFATIGGVWGFHTDYANAWLEVDVLVGAIDATQKTLVVDDIAGVTDYDETPRISAGNILQIDDEWMDVVATDATTNTVTVIRGVNGSTAAVHADDTPVSVFQCEENVRRACARQVALLYARQGAFNTARVSQYSNADFPEDVLQEVWQLLQAYANV